MKICVLSSRDVHPRDIEIVSFNTIGNNSISHHMSWSDFSPPVSPRTPRCDAHPENDFEIDVDTQVSMKDENTNYAEVDNVKSNASRISWIGCIRKYGSWYAAQLEYYPIRTKSFTAGALAVVGDALAQIIEHGSDLRTSSDVLFDSRRMFAMFVEGSCVSGPMLHFVFQFYEYLIPIHYIEECVLKDQSNNPKDNEISATEYGHFDESMDISAQEYEASRRQIVAALLHVIFDQVVMAFPYVGGMMIVTALVEGHGGNLRTELEEEYMNNVRASWVAALGLAPFQFFSFRYLPSSFRVLAVNLQDIIWVMFMSYVTHRTREPSEPFFEFSTDDFADHDDLFSIHYNSTHDAGEY